MRQMENNNNSTHQCEIQNEFPLIDVFSQKNKSLSEQKELQMLSEEVIQFWFGPDDSNNLPSKEIIERWFVQDEHFDQLIKDKFGRYIDQINAGKFITNVNEIHQILGLVIVLDQFSRNIYRDNLKAFQNDPLAVNLAVKAIASNQDKQLSPIFRWFLYMPFQHSESITLQHMSINQFDKLQKDCVTEAECQILKSAYNHAQKHFDVIQHFGRFPHRNKIMGRESTTSESHYLSTLVKGSYYNFDYFQKFKESLQKQHQQVITALSLPSPTNSPLIIHNFSYSNLSQNSNVFYVGPPPQSIDPYQILSSSTSNHFNNEINLTNNDQLFCMPYTNDNANFLLCFGKDSNIFIFPYNNQGKDSYNKNLLHDYILGDYYNRDQCKPIEFHGRNSMRCNGLNSNLVYQPQMPSMRLQNINAQIMLFAILFYLLYNFFHWIITKATNYPQKKPLQNPFAKNKEIPIIKVQNELYIFKKYLNNKKQLFSKKYIEWMMLTIEQYNKQALLLRQNDCTESELNEFFKDLHYFFTNVISEVPKCAKNDIQNSINITNPHFLFFKKNLHPISQPPSIINVDSKNHFSLLIKNQS